MPNSIPPSFHMVNHVNIDDFPMLDAKYPYDEGAQLTLGDLHGNALKLLYILIRHGVLTNITKEDKIAFNRLYKKSPHDITDEDLKWFPTLLAKAKVNPKGTLRLVGDDLADRGSNDLFVLCILAKLFNKTNLEILISNHGIEFIEAYEKGKKYISQRLGGGLANSMQNMQRLIDKGFSRKIIDQLFEKKYLPNLKLLSYTLDEENNRIAYFTHAPMFDFIGCAQAMAAELGVKFKDNTIHELAQTIECMNKAFMDNYVRTGKIHILFKDTLKDPSVDDPTTHPFTHLIWNRKINKNHPTSHKGYELKAIHGHDSSPANVTHKHYNLDNMLGKGPDDVQGPYYVHYTHEKQLHTKMFEHEAEEAAPSALNVHPAAVVLIGAAAGAGVAYALALTLPLIALSAMVASMLIIGTLKLINRNRENVQDSQTTHDDSYSLSQINDFAELRATTKGYTPHAKSTVSKLKHSKSVNFDASADADLDKTKTKKPTFSGKK